MVEAELGEEVGKAASNGDYLSMCEEAGEKPDKRGQCFRGWWATASEAIERPSRQSRPQAPSRTLSARRPLEAAPWSGRGSMHQR